MINLKEAKKIDINQYRCFADYRIESMVITDEDGDRHDSLDGHARNLTDKYLRGFQKCKLSNNRYCIMDTRKDKRVSPLFKTYDDVSLAYDRLKERLPGINIITAGKDFPLKWELDQVDRARDAYLIGESKSGITIEDLREIGCGLGQFNNEKYDRQYFVFHLLERS